MTRNPSSTPIRVPTPAGHALAGTVFSPIGPPRGAVLIAPATGIRRGFYAPFAERLAEQGFGVLSFEFQGIGDSLTGALRDCPATLVSWGSNDLAAGIDALARHFPGVSLQLVGHSAGAQLLGLAPNAPRLASLLAVAGSSGRLSGLRWPFRAGAEVFMRGLIPASNALVGYARTDRVGMGGPLPRGVAAQWARWCAGGGYAETGFGREVQAHGYGSLDLPSRWVSASDDPIAVSANVEDGLRVFARMAPHAERLTLHPADYGLQKIGHMGFFRPQARALWPVLSAWLDQSADTRQM